MRVNSLARGLKAAKKPRGRASRAALRSASGAISQQRQGELRPNGPGDGAPKRSLTATAAAGILYPFRYPSCRTLQ
jgi:hypothetical protein